MVLVFDGNNFIMKNLFLLKDKSEKTFLKEFYKFFLYDIFSFINSFNNVEQVYIAFDFGSWRKKYLKEEFNQETYKSQRKDYNEKTKVFKNIVFENLDKLKELIESFDINTITVYSAEADDIIYSICNKLNNKNIIIISSDNDLVQLTEFNSRWVVKLNSVKNNKKIYLTKEFYTNLMENKFNTPVPDSNLFNENKSNLKSASDIAASLFNKNKKTDEEFLKKYIDENSIEIIPIDKKIFILEKILLGDVSDNIEGLKLSNLLIGKNTINEIKTNNLFELKEKMFNDLLNNNFNSILEEINKINDKKISNENFNELIDKIKKNKKLMFLYETEIPFNIMEKINMQLNEKNKPFRNQKVYFNNILNKIEELDI